VAGDPAFKAPQESYDYTAAMKQVAAKFKGNAGVYLHLGDGITYTSSNTLWARAGEGHTVAEKAFLKWSHVGERNDSDGWYLASADVPSGNVVGQRSHTAANGLRAENLLKNDRSGLPPLQEIIDKYQPQLALYMLGTCDIEAGRPANQYYADVAKAIDLLLANGTVVIVSTLPPFDGQAQQVNEYNNAIRRIARIKQVPFIDLHAEMKARAGDQMEALYLPVGGGYPLSGLPATGPATDENLKRCGYLLRCYLAVHKGMEVKAKVFDVK
jgi:hypothetical protein